MLLTLLQTRAAPIVVIDTHDGGDRRRRKFQEDTEKREKRRAEIIAAYEHLVEGKPLIAEAIVAEFKQPQQSERIEARIDWDRLLNDLDTVERLWAAYLDADDEDILLLI